MRTFPVLVRSAVLLVAIAALVAGALAGPAPASPAGTTNGTAATADLPTSRKAPALHVDGAQLVGRGGHPIQLGGVNRAGAEYACQQGWGIFDGPVDRPSIMAIASWHANSVRVPLNESCWLGISGVDPDLSGAIYRKAITGFVHRIERRGLNVILDLHFAHDGDVPAQDLQKMPNADHTPDFWRSVAKKYGDDRAIVFDLFNEPHDVGWACWRDGCEIDGYQAVGMQRLVKVVRNTGAKNVILLGGIGWSGDISQWAAHMPNDPRHNLTAGWHVYNFSACTDPTCWASQVGGVAGQAPVIIGELGQTDCAHWFVDQLMGWADDRGIGYLAWTWDAWPTCDGPTLISDYDGTPTAYGEGIRAHYLDHFSP